jgi:anthranilate synthase component II
MKILVVDNYDSFTYNIVHYLGLLGAEVEVVRNDAITSAQIASRGAERILISPGPCDPEKAGISLDVIRAYAGKLPILGVCLGHQSIGHAFGGKVIRAKTIKHGKTSEVFHEGAGVFAGLPQPFVATRYHSLAVERSSLPSDLIVTAWTEDGEIMGLKHRTLAVEGVQFHPESILTTSGMDLLKNFLR